MEFLFFSLGSVVTIVAVIIGAAIASHTDKEK